MTFDGVTAVQSRIAQIQQLTSGNLTGVGSTSAAGATGTSTPGTTATAAQAPEFASLLADAMATDATQSDPLSDSSSDDSDSSTGDTAMVSQLMQLAQMETGSSLGTTGLSGLATDPTFAALGGSGVDGTTLDGTGTDDTSLDSLLAAIDPSALTDMTSTTATSPMTASGTSPMTASGTSPMTASGTSPLTASGTSPMTASGTSPLTASGSPNAVTQAFLNNALSQQGKPYVYGATALTSDPNPPAFDCSELTKWAAARAGDPIPDGATAQYLYIRDHGDTMSVQQALHTPGALLFHFSHEPKNLGDIPPDGHVAISLGDGVHTMEAKGHAYGTNVFSDASDGYFNFAGVIPGMN